MNSRERADRGARRCRARSVRRAPARDRHGRRPRSPGELPEVASHPRSPSRARRRPGRADDLERRPAGDRVERGLEARQRARLVSWIASTTPTPSAMPSDVMRERSGSRARRRRMNQRNSAIMRAGRAAAPSPGTIVLDASVAHVHARDSPRRRSRPRASPAASSRRARDSGR